jgi:hypothetical protein
MDHKFNPKNEDLSVKNIEIKKYKMPFYQ